MVRTTAPKVEQHDLAAKIRQLDRRLLLDPLLGDDLRRRQLKASSLKIFSGSRSGLNMPTGYVILCIDSPTAAIDRRGANRH